MITVADAIMSLRPGVEWSMSGEDVEGIIWHTEGAEPLTRAMVDSQIARLEEEALLKKAEEQTARVEAINHAKSLGFTDEMIRVMYPNLIV
jgi:hypothetical protein